MSVRNEVRVGLTVILGIALVVFGTLWLQGWRLGQEEAQVEAWVREVGQLRDGSTVKLRGVPIGRVEAIRLDTLGTGVIIRMNVRGDVALPEDPVVVLAPESLFGDWQVEIYSLRQFPFYEYAPSPYPGVMAGYTLPDMSRLTAVLDRIAGNLAVITDRVELAFTDETAINIREAIDNIQEVTGALTGLVQAQEQTVQEVATGLQETTSTLRDAASAANRTFSAVEDAIAGGKLGRIVDNMNAMTAQLDTLSRVLRVASTDLGGTVASADSTFASLNQIMSALERGEGTLGQLLQDTALYADLVITTNILQDLLEDFQRNPGKYINLRVF